ncbi:acetyl-CoA carboxylase biotin carboxyl carrier protein [Gluconacetobacter sp.]|uniref:acetyl-CoA carboxylase biotin carboxyl carrier protein n=1 Tax=Gluconacetobacter sp. TaxID=1935994 RepID=UPI0039ED664A
MTLDMRHLDRLVDQMIELGLERLKYQDAETHILLVRSGNPRPSTAHALRLAPAAAPAVPDPAETITAPMYGRFYRAPAPEDAPFVQAGDDIAEGQPLCIIEAMKTLSRFEAPFACRIVSILCDNGQDIVPGTPLFTVEPRHA